jgi:uncharacterized membrane protein required for colicin V production
MDLGLLGQLNWLAVAAATVVYFALGGVWFIPKVFGDAWTRSIGWEPSEEDTPGPAVYLGPLATCFLATVAIALLARAANASGIGEGLVLGLVTGVGIAGAVLFVTGYFDPKKPKPMVWFAIMASYHLLGLVIAAIIVTVWT